MKFYSFLVYGRKGHRQRETFFASNCFIDCTGTAAVTLNADVTRTHEYSIVMIEGEDLLDATDRLNAQIDDGIFENSVTGNFLPEHTPYLIQEYRSAWAKAVKYIWEKRFYGVDIPYFELKEASLTWKK